jgi:RNA polymerase sigma-70 factor (ECF subfamily)
VASLEAPEPDGELVRRACDGDAWARDALFRRHIPTMTRLATRLIGRTEAADDVVQDTLVEALRDLPKLREPDAFRGWILRITVNRARKSHRRQRLTRWLGLDRSLEDAPLSRQARTDVTPEALSELALLDRVLGRVPTEERFAWLLRHVEGHTLEAVAELTDCSLATAKRRIAAVQTHLEAHVARGAAEHEDPEGKQASGGVP